MPFTSVTAVHTCPIPIYKQSPCFGFAPHARRCSSCHWPWGSTPAKAWSNRNSLASHRYPRPRSEERRVGKECTARDPRQHWIKKKQIFTTRSPSLTELG